jgi:hypothetical protein
LMINAVVLILGMGERMIKNQLNRVNRLKKILVFLFPTFCLSVFAEPYNGFNFYGNGVDLKTKSCQLLDMNGKILHEWKSNYALQDKPYLLRDSSVLWPGIDNTDLGQGKFPAGTLLSYFVSGRFQIIKWDGTVAWDFPYRSATYIPHHDCYPVYFTNDPKELPHVFAVVYSKENSDTISEKIVEIKPTGKTTGEIVWEWKAWDHKTDNGTDNPALLDIKKGWMSAMGKGKTGEGTLALASGEQYKEWLHVNYVRFNPVLDQVMVNIKAFSEFVILDHTTTIAEAAGHTGGKYGKGGDILYRWGNPKSYGCTGTQYFKGQHAACWIPMYMPGTRKPLPGAGNILVISNGDQKGYEITPDHNNGVYPRIAGKAYGPEKPLKTFDLPILEINEGTLQRLPNGNTFVCNGRTSNRGSRYPGIEEYDASWKQAWKLDSVVAYQCFRYDSAYMGSTLIETENNNNTQNPLPPKEPKASRIMCRVEKGMAFIAFMNNGPQPALVNIYSFSGRTVLRKIIIGSELTWDKRTVSSGIYYIKVVIGRETIMGRLSVVGG